MRIVLVIPLALVVLTTLGGCQSPLPGTPIFPVYEDLLGGAPEQRQVDVQVFRNGKQMLLTNTTPEPLPSGLLWVNKRFSYPFVGANVGETVRIKLNLARDQYGEPFRAGGFFATRNPDFVTIVQIQPTPGTVEVAEGEPELIGLVVVDNDIR